MYESIKMFSDECRRASMAFLGIDDGVEGWKLYNQEVKQCDQYYTVDNGMMDYPLCCSSSRIQSEGWYQRHGHVWFVRDKKLANKLLYSTEYEVQEIEKPTYPVQILFPTPVLGIGSMIAGFDAYGDVVVAWNENSCFCHYDHGVRKAYHTGFRILGWEQVLLDRDVSGSDSHLEKARDLCKLFLGLLCYIQGTETLAYGVPDSDQISKVRDDNIKTPIPGQRNSRSHVIEVDPDLVDEEEIRVIQGPKRTSVVSVEHYRRGCQVTLMHPRYRRNSDGSARTVWRSATWVKGRSDQETRIIDGDG